MTTTNAVTTFTFAATGADLRVVSIEGKPWFAATDVMAALNLDTNQSSNHLRSLSEDERVMVTRWTNTNLSRDGRGSSRLTLVSESGLYKLVLRAHPDRVPQVREFQDWVTREVLLSIRKDGGYIMGEEKVATGEMSEDEPVHSPFSGRNRCASGPPIFQRNLSHSIS